jgi:alpha-mannosidase
VSLLNDCKYGHDVRDNVMRISLLRAPTFPDPEADQGRHHFVYSLLPHHGTWGETTIRNAYALNDPLIVADLRDLRPALPLGLAAGTADDAVPLTTMLLALDRLNIVVETVKRAEDGRGIIVRCYESQRHRGPATLETGFRLKEAWRTNILEEDQEALPVENERVTFPVRPYEIITLRLIPA